MDKVFIIAEAGVNHNGSVRIAKKLIDAAAAAGADAVKFQTFRAEKMVTREAPGAKYQMENTGSRKSQFELFRQLELPLPCYRELFLYCKKRKIMFMSTPFDEESADFLDGLGMNVFKIASGEITNKPLIERIAAKRKPIILSTGMSCLGEVRKAVRWIRNVWKPIAKKPPLTLLHCVSNYPAKAEDTNLRAIGTLGKTFGLSAGLSDHTLGIEMPIAAAAMGAKVVEKHFTLSRKMKGPDHRASLEPDELKAMVIAVRNVERAMGDGIKRPVDSEDKIKKIARKSLVAARDIKAGSVIKRSHISIKRPGNGIPPELIDKIINKKTRLDVKKDSLLKYSDLMHVSYGRNTR